MFFDYAQEILHHAISKLGLQVQPEIELPRHPQHGDAATNVALQLARALGKPPRTIAEDIVAAMEYDRERIAAIEIAGPGFINMRFRPRYYADVLLRMLEQGERFGYSARYAGKRANVEYVSANPTGPLHPGHGRNIALGDSIARLLEAVGYTVTREYYFNNAGRQMYNLARSIYARYRQLLGDDYPFDEENGYRGSYIYDIARELIAEYGERLREETEENLAICRAKGEQWCFASIRRTLERLGVHHDVYFNEHSLYTDGHIERTVEQLRQRGLVYEKDGATWIATTKLGLDQDRVIIKSTGEPTYRLPDMAYHCIKLSRGDDLVVDVFGADHIATIQEVLAAVKALGYDTSRVKVVLHQMVTFMKDGAPYKLSKRSGEQYTLDDLIEELGADVVRYFFAMRAAETQLVFDLNLAREQSENNPVFYLQYAHARICSVFANAQQLGVCFDGIPDLRVLGHHPAECALIKALAQFPAIVERAAEQLAPYIVADYLHTVAEAFHTFYHECRILGAETNQLVHARMALAGVTRVVLRNGLHLLGVHAPERM
ncbi:MAG: arginine--tRNA ligase [Bacteroidota bacterium]|nr:arginine--tRNA ligase [Candidatus Kapabacteria bacterium]MCS7301952.1 arginine--tRNA ligase [Candidatus Kapabacteria bacterium]MDW8074785.1 arginine--tRNA ligase [Bacteroidota bacterium]MDW8271424.1 arginine--tRNA ligase [Bacteroidota bacterium]